MGRVDVDNMLAEMTPEQLNEWIAAWRAGLLRDEWEMAGSIAAEVHNGFNVVRSLRGEKIKEDDYYSWKEYDPSQESKSEKKRGEESIRRFQARAKARYGS